MKVSAIFVATGAGRSGDARATPCLRSTRRSTSWSWSRTAAAADRACSRRTFACVENERPLGFSANVNKGIQATSGEYVVISNPDAVPEAGCIAGARPLR